MCRDAWNDYHIKVGWLLLYEMACVLESLRILLHLKALGHGSCSVFAIDVRPLEVAHAARACFLEKHVLPAYEGLCFSVITTANKPRYTRLVQQWHDPYLIGLS